MPAPVRVGLDVTPLLGPPSGIHQMVVGILDGLRSHDSINTSGWLLTRRDDKIAGLEISVHSAKIPARLAQLSWRRCGWPSAARLAGPVDIVHGTNFMAPPHASSVITVNDLTPVTHPQWTTPAVRRMVAPLRRAVRAGATIHVTSHIGAAEARQHLGADPGQIEVVPLGIPHVGAGTPGSGRAHTGFERYILMMGTLEFRKNAAALVNALPALPPDVGLVLAGPPGNASSAVVDAIERNGVEDRVRVLGVVDDQTRADLLADAAILAFPSLLEGFGFPPLEAALAGVPVVATAVGALPELIGTSIDLVTPGDTVAFTEQILATLDNPQLGIADPTHVRSLTWERTTAELVDIYHRVAENR